jgi:hypothetical protein
LKIARQFIAGNLGLRERNQMKGIKFIVDDKGKKTAVLIDLKEHGDLWEDFYDKLIARSRDDEPRESLESVRKTMR